MTTASIIEALLFFKGEPLSVKFLSKLLRKKEEEIRQSFLELRNSLEGRGVVAIIKGDEISLGTHPETAPLIEELLKEEATGPLSRASLETLSVILYRAPITKTDIDYIRGVNSGFILRNLLLRGLIEKEENPNDLRTFLYQPTRDLFAHLGIKERGELPEFKEYSATIQKALETKDDGTL